MRVGSRPTPRWTLQFNKISTSSGLALNQYSQVGRRADSAVRRIRRSNRRARRGRSHTNHETVIGRRRVGILNLGKTERVGGVSNDIALTVDAVRADSENAGVEQFAR